MSRNNIKKGKNKLILAAAVFFAVSMVVFPKVTESGSKGAMVIWLNSVVPVLLPFFIFSDFIRRSGDLEKLPPQIYPFVIAFLSGYPMGAKIVGDMVCEGNISSEEGEKILSYSMVTGPAFILGTVGAMLGNSRIAWIIAAAHYAGAVFNGIVFGSGKMAIQSKRVSLSRNNTQSSYMENFSASILAGFRAMAVILAYIMFFMIGINMLESLGTFSVLNSEARASFAKGLMEMTVGINMIGMCNLSLKLKCIAAAFLVSFGGLSVIGQSVSMTQGSGIGTGTIIRIKLFHGLWAAASAWLMTLFI